MGSGGWNVGLFGFPLIESIWGAKALLFAIMYDIGNTFLAFGVLYPIGSHFSEVPSRGKLNMLKKVLLLPPVLGMIMGLTLNASNIPLPNILEDVLTTLAKANKPLVLLLLGIYLSFNLDKNQFNGGGWPMRVISRTESLSFTLKLFPSQIFQLTQYNLSLRAQLIWPAHILRGIKSATWE